MRIFKRLCPAAAFLVLFLLINSLLNYALVPYQYPRVKIHTIETQTFDDLVFGTSHSFSAVTPEILSSSTGRSCYNASVGNQSPRDTLYLLMDACRKHRPGRIILEYDPSYLVDADRAFVNERYFVQCMAASPVKMKFFLDCALDSDFRVALMPWIGHRGERSEISRNLRIKKSDAWKNYGLEPFDDGRQHMTQQGQMRIASTEFNPAAPEIKRFSPDEIQDNLNDLKRVLRFCNREGIAVVIVTTPVPAETREKHSEYYNAAHQLMDDIASSYSVPFLDYAWQHDSRLADATENFSDLEGHMHEDAADRFSAVLAADLNAL